jgi:hypothetical protein
LSSLVLSSSPSPASLLGSSFGVPVVAGAMSAPADCWSLPDGAPYEKLSSMGMSRWLERQRGWRLFLILWAFHILLYAAILLGVNIGAAAYHPGYHFRAPPVWVFPLLVLTSAGMAATQIRAMRRRMRIREARASAKSADP